MVVNLQVYYYNVFFRCEDWSGLDSVKQNAQIILIVCLHFIVRNVTLQTE